MSRVDVGVHEKNGDRLDVEFSYFAGKRFQRWDRQRSDHFTLAVHPFGDFEAQLTRNQRFIPLIMKIKRIGPVTARNFQNIAKDFTGYQGSLRALALNRRVDD